MEDPSAGTHDGMVTSASAVPAKAAITNAQTGRPHSVAAEFSSGWVVPEPGYGWPPVPGPGRGVCAPPGPTTVPGVTGLFCSVSTLGICLVSTISSPNRLHEPRGSTYEHLLLSAKSANW